MAVTVTTFVKPTLAVYLASGGSHINTNVDQDSSAGANATLYLASTTGIEAGMILQVDPDSSGGGYEEVVVVSVSAGVSIVVENLQFNHTLAQADEVTIKWYYVIQAKNSPTIFTVNNLNVISKFSDEKSALITSANKQVIIFTDPTVDSTHNSYMLGRTYESGNYSIRDTQCWFYTTAALKTNLRASITSTTVDADSAAGGTTLFVTSTTGLAVNDWIIINMGGPREEARKISAVTAGVSVTVAALTYTHLAVDADNVFENIGEDDFDNV